jgi:hypothetical protein
MGAVIGPWGALAGGLLGAGFAWWQGSEASDLQKQQADFERWRTNTQADLEQQRNDEQLRRFDASVNQQKGLATASAAASGAELSSPSLQGYLASLATEFRKQRDWLRMSGTNQVDFIRQMGGKQADLMAEGADLSQQSADWGAIADIGSALGKFGAANNWWQKPKGG